MKKKIIHVIDTLEQGGAQQYLLDLLAALKNDFDFLVLAFEGGPVANKIKKLNIKVKILGIAPQDIGFSRPANIKKVLYWLQKSYNNFQPHIIQTHLLGADTWARLASPKKVKLIQTIHAADSFRGKIFSRKGLKNMFFDKALIKKTALVVVVSKAAEQSIFKENISENKIKLIYSGIDRKKFFPQKILRKKIRLLWNLKTTDLGFLAVGRLDKIKGFDILIKAFNLIIKKNQNLKLFFIGDGGERKNLKILVKNLNLTKKIFFLGERHDVNKLLNAADIFVLPSREEGRALVLLEAAANEKAIIASRVGGIPEFIKDQENGLLFRVGDEVDLAQKMIKLIKNKKLRFKLAQKAFTEGKKYTIKTMAKKYRKIYNLI
ncbi:MAG: glycosyltransferase [Patescibacteria group bacterium]|nr:glycosyltransferase [Patescibacteria group bacterium]